MFFVFSSFFSKLLQPKQRVQSAVFLFRTLWRGLGVDLFDQYTVVPRLQRFGVGSRDLSVFGDAR